MSVAQHEASYLDFGGLDGIFDTKHHKITAGWLGTYSTGVQTLPFSGVLAEAVQTVAITAREDADNLLAIGNKGHAGYVRKFGGVDVTIDAILTDNVMTSGGIGYQLSDFESVLPTGLVLITTNSVQGKKATVTGMYVSTISFNFNQNAASTMAMNFLADGVAYDTYFTATSGVVGNRDYSCVDPLTWDEVHLFDGLNSIVLTGVQTATFAATINRQEIFEIGQFTPYDRAVIHPYNVSVTLNTLANDVNLVNWWSKFVPSYDPMSDCGGGFTIKVRTRPIQSDAIVTGANASYDFIIASGMRPATSTFNVAVGTNSTVALNFIGTSLFF